MEGSKIGRGGNRRKTGPRPNADTDHDHVGRERSAALERDVTLADRRRRVFEVKDDAFFLVEGLDEARQVRSHDSLQRHLLRCYDMHLEVAGAKRCRNLESYETGPNDKCTFGPFRARNDSAAIGE